MAENTTFAMSADGKPIATMKVIDSETGTETPVNVATCTDAVVCPEGKTAQEHLQTLYAHVNDEGAHLTPEQKAALETQAGAQEKATTAKKEAVTEASLLVSSAKAEAATDATTKSDAARDAAYRYADGIGADLDSHVKNVANPHKVTAAQVGLGNVPNKTTNDTTPTYTEASSVTALTSGEKLSVAFGKIAKAVSALISHTGNKSNPHGVTASQVGLGNVPNKATNDQTPSYTAASSLTALTSGEKLSVAFGKLSKAVSSLISHIGNKSNPHGVTASQAGALPLSGGTMTGKVTTKGIVLTSGTDYGTSLPSSGTKGQIFFLQE